MEGIINFERHGAFDLKRNYSQKLRRKQQTLNINDIDNSFSSVIWNTKYFKNTRKIAKNNESWNRKKK